MTQENAQELANEFPKPTGFTCYVCQEPIMQTSKHTAGYGSRMPHRDDKYDREKAIKVCFSCCGKEDLASMLETGKYTLYLSMEEVGETSPAFDAKEITYANGWRGYVKPDWQGRWTKQVYIRNIKVSNWPDTLKVKVSHMRIGRHNWANHQYQVWFDVVNEAKGIVEQWYGYCIGDSTQILHCRRTKKFYPIGGTKEVNLVMLGGGILKVLTLDGKEYESTWDKLKIKSNSTRVELKGVLHKIVWDAQPAGKFGFSADPNSPYYVKKEEQKND